MTDTTASIATARSFRTVQQPLRRVLAVWVFCVAGLAFWIGFIAYFTGLPIAAMALVGALLACAAFPLAIRLAGIIWDELDGSGASGGL